MSPFLRQNIATLMEWWRDGKLKPHVSLTFPLEDTVEALRAMTTRRSTGQVVVTI